MRWEYFVPEWLFNILEQKVSLQPSDNLIITFSNLKHNAKHFLGVVSEMDEDWVVFFVIYDSKLKIIRF